MLVLRATRAQGQIGVGQVKHGIAPEYWQHPADWDDKPTHFYELVIKPVLSDVLGVGIMTPLWGYNGQYRAMPSLLAMANRLWFETLICCLMIVRLTCTADIHRRTLMGLLTSRSRPAMPVTITIRTSLPAIETAIWTFWNARPRRAKTT